MVDTDQEKEAQSILSAKSRNHSVEEKELAVLIFFTKKLSLYMYNHILLYKQELPDRVNTLLEMISI